jgi:pterin-4a-carbinolamine dehydratase
MTEALAEKTCALCRGGIPPLTRDEAQRLQAQARDWQLADDAHRIERTFRFRNFRESLAFVQEVGELAETEGWSPTFLESRGTVAEASRAFARRANKLAYTPDGRKKSMDTHTRGVMFGFCL